MLIISLNSLSITNQNKDAVTVRNAIAQVFIRRYPRILQTNNEKEFVNKVLSTYLDSIKVEHVLSAPVNPQSQGEIEAINKIVQKELLKAYDNTKKYENEKIDLELNLNSFYQNYDWKRQHVTTWLIPKYVMDIFNDQNIREIVSLASDRSRKRHLENSWCKFDKEALITNWIHKINSIKNTLNMINRITKLSLRESLDMIQEINS